MDGIKDITKFFEKKKRDLSNNSKTEENPKRQREGSNESSSVVSPDINDEVFAESLKSPESVSILLNCIKNVEKQVQAFHNDSDIKGESRFDELKTSISFICEKFEAFEKRLEEKDEIIRNLQHELQSARKDIDDQAQYSRRNCILLHGIKENKNEDTDNLVVETITSKLKVAVSVEDLDRSHRVGQFIPNSTKSRPIIVKFARYNKRRSVFIVKKNLKGSGISITESLTKNRMAMLTEAREAHGFKNVWSLDGRIYYLDESTGKGKMYYS